MLIQTRCLGHNAHPAATAKVSANEVTLGVMELKRLFTDAVARVGGRTIEFVWRDPDGMLEAVARCANGEVMIGSLHALTAEICFRPFYKAAPAVPRADPTDPLDDPEMGWQREED